MNDGILNEKIFLQNLNASFDQLDQLRIEGLAELKLLQEVKSRVLKKERQRSPAYKKNQCQITL